MNAIQRLDRSVRVGWTAARIFAGYRWLAWRDRRLPAAEAERRLVEHHRRSGQHILANATRLKGMLIKLGQLMGARADILSDEYIEVHSQLHDTVPHRPCQVIRGVVEEELGAPIVSWAANSLPRPPTRHAKGTLTLQNPREIDTLQPLASLAQEQGITSYAL